MKSIVMSLVLTLLLSVASICAGTIHIPADQPTIQAGISAAVNGDTVLVDPGIYFENINFRGKNIVVTSRFFLTSDVTVIHSTVINGSLPAYADTGSCVLIISGEDTTAVLQGFTLTGGTGTGWQDEHGAGRYNEGGGILIALSSPTIRYNIIRNNNVNKTLGTSTGGGGIRLGDGSPRILNNYITMNAAMYGGGIVSNYATPIIRNNVVSKNVVSPAIPGKPTYGGGGIWINNQPARLDNNTIVENSSTGTGAAPAGRGGGIVAYFGGSATGSNNLVWANTQTMSGQLYGSFTLTYCDVQSGASGTGNFTASPEFLDSSYFLSPTSPCVDAGDTAAGMNDPEDPMHPGIARFPARGGLRSDVGAYGGPWSGPTFSLAEAPAFTKIMTGAHVTTPSASRSVNWIDYNKDGVLDLFVSNGPSSGQNNFLYRGDGPPEYSFTPVTGSPIVQDNAKSDGSSWADVDNNGTLDAFIVNWYGQNNMLFMGDGHGAFTRVTSGIVVTDGGYSETCSWGDYDNDGHVDLYVTNSGYIGVRAWENSLYHNNGDSTFSKILSGEIVTDAYYSRGCTWIDYDSDGDIDLFVANENGGNNCLYRNMLVESSTATFQKVTTGSIVNDGGDSWSGSWGDYDNDGDPDLFVANTSNQDNFLYTNNGDGTFTKVTAGVIVHDGGWSASGAWGDLDNDGDLDLTVTSAYGPSQLRNVLYRNTLMETGEAHFEKVISGPFVNDAGFSYGIALGDYDRDGDLDAFVAKTYSENENNALFRNDYAGGNHWLEVKCSGNPSNRAAIGARIRARAIVGGIPQWQLREISGQSGYCGQSLEAHFGLGDATVIDSLIVLWPSGNTDVFTSVGTNRVLSIVEGDTLPVHPVFPPDGSMDQPPSVSFSWTASLSTATYRFQLAADSGFSTILVDENLLPDTAYLAPPLPLKQSYFWRIGVHRIGRTDGWSAVRSFTLGAQPYTYPVAERWNLVSIPIEAVASHRDTLFPTAATQVYAFVSPGVYSNPESLHAGSGYWARFAAAGNVIMRGFPLISDTIPVVEGWNLIGSISAPVPVDAVMEEPVGILASRFFGFNDGYQAADSIHPSSAYWIKATSAGTLILGPNPPLRKTITFREATEKLNQITIQDATGSVRHLYFAGSSEQTPENSANELPPPPPAGVLDVRYSSNRLVECFKPDQKTSVPLLLASAQYPLTVSWDIQDHAEWFLLDVDGIEYPLSLPGAITLSRPCLNIALSVSAKNSGPRTTRLEQNYPNPFNPATTIAYELASSGEVSLRIYDILGREIRTLVSGQQEEGRHVVQWDGLGDDQNPVSTGIYYCQLVTTDGGKTRTSVRKMTIME
jgi:hypothetical protein